MYPSENKRTLPDWFEKISLKYPSYVLPKSLQGKQRDKKTCNTLIAKMPIDMVFLIAVCLPDIDKFYLLAIFQNAPYIFEDIYAAVLKIKPEDRLPERLRTKTFYVQKDSRNQRMASVHWWQAYQIKHVSLNLGEVCWLNSFIQSDDDQSHNYALLREIMLICKPQTVENRYLETSVQNSLSTRGLLSFRDALPLPGFGLIEDYIYLAANNIAFISFIAKSVQGQLHGCYSSLDFALKELQKTIAQLPLNEEQFSRNLEEYCQAKKKTAHFYAYLSNTSAFLFRWTNSAKAPREIKSGFSDCGFWTSGILKKADTFETQNLAPFQQQRLERPKKQSDDVVVQNKAPDTKKCVIS